MIPARGGSKGLPKKNVLSFSGKPLIAHTINQAKNSKYIDRIILSSEDKEIIDIVSQYNVDIPFIRPKHLSDDHTSGVDVALHAIKNIPGYEIFIVLQPTSPLRSTEDIDNCIEKLFY